MGGKEGMCWHMVPEVEKRREEKISCLSLIDSPASLVQPTGPEKNKNNTLIDKWAQQKTHEQKHIQTHKCMVMNHQHSIFQACIEMEAYKAHDLNR